MGASPTHFNVFEDKPQMHRCHSHSIQNILCLFLSVALSDCIGVIGFQNQSNFWVISWLYLVMVAIVTLTNYNQYWSSTTVGDASLLVLEIYQYWLLHTFPGHSGMARSPPPPLWKLLRNGDLHARQARIQGQHLQINQRWCCWDHCPSIFCDVSIRILMGVS